MTRIYAALLTAALALAAPASATVSTTPVALSTTAWTDLGAGPMRISPTGVGGAWYQIADTQPALSSAGLPIDGPAVDVQTTSHVWALAARGATPTLLVAPVSAWNGGTVTGNVGGYEFQLAPSITVQNAAYSAGYSLGGTITATGVARTAGGSGILNGLRIRSAGGSTNTIWVYAWSKSPASTCTDKAAFSASAADAPNALVGFPQSVTLVSPGSFDTATYASITNLVSNFINKDTSPGTPLYFCLVTAGSVTPATTGDLTFMVSGIQD